MKQPKINVISSGSDMGYRVSFLTENGQTVLGENFFLNELECETFKAGARAALQAAEWLSKHS